MCTIIYMCRGENDFRFFWNSENRFRLDSSVTEFSKTESVSDFSYRKQNRNRCDVLPTVFSVIGFYRNLPKFHLGILPDIYKSSQTVRPTCQRLSPLGHRGHATHQGQPTMTTHQPGRLFSKIIKKIKSTGDLTPGRAKGLIALHKPR
jgi:hypothetical protein